MVRIPDPTKPTLSRPLWPSPMLRASEMSSSTLRSVRWALSRKAAPAGGQHDGPRRAGQELTADDALELADRLRQRGLGHVQTLGGMPEVQLFGDRHEVAQVAELDIHRPRILTETNEILDVLISCLHTAAMELIIRPLENDADAAAFRALNEEWIAAYFAIEEHDRRQLDDPVAAYIDPGGEILIAELGGRAVGCVALVPDGTGAFELSKMTIAPQLRGRGAGRRLLAAAIEHARQMGAESLFLGSSTKLADAVHLYEAAGFEHVTPETIHMPYARADVFMRLTLRAPSPLRA